MVSKCPIIRHGCAIRARRARGVEAISGAFMMIRATRLERLGRVQRRYFMYGEDLTFASSHGAMDSETIM